MLNQKIFMAATCGDDNVHINNLTKTSNMVPTRQSWQILLKMPEQGKPRSDIHRLLRSSSNDQLLSDKMPIFINGITLEFLGMLILFA